jgi:hypothetical protein
MTDAAAPAPADEPPPPPRLHLFTLTARKTASPGGKPAAMNLLLRTDDAPARWPGFMEPNAEGVQALRADRLVRELLDARGWLLDQVAQVEELNIEKTLATPELNTAMRTAITHALGAGVAYVLYE